MKQGTILALMGLATSLPLSAEQSGRVLSVSDGDTLIMVLGDQRVNVRLRDIDAPELAQPFGDKSKQSLSDLCLTKDARVQDTAKDRYGRTLARVHCAGIDANEEQVRRGMAWVFDRYAQRSSPLYEVEREARKDRRGLWVNDAPVPPWDWRALNRRGIK